MFRSFAVVILAIVASANQLTVAQSTLSTDGDGGWIGFYDYLKWSVRSGDVEYAITDIGGVQDRGAVGQVLSLGGNYEVGSRLGVGYRMEKGPELLFQFTDFDSSLAETAIGSHRSTFVSSDNSENDDSDNINTLGVETVTPDDRATSVFASKSFDYQVFDLELAQTLKLTDDLSLRLGGGGRAASIDQAFAARYTGGDFQTPFSAFKTGEYRGGGITAGGDVIWQLLPWLRFNVGSNLAMMLGTVETRVFIPDDEPGVPTDVTFEERRMTPVLDMSAGVELRHKFGCFLVSVAGGYEMTNWFNLSDSRVFTDPHMEAQNAHLINDVSLDGAYFRVALNR